MLSQFMCSKWHNWISPMSCHFLSFAHGFLSYSYGFPIPMIFLSCVSNGALCWCNYLYIIEFFDSLKLIRNGLTSHVITINFSLLWFDFYYVCGTRRIVSWFAFSSCTAANLHARIIARWTRVTRSTNVGVMGYSTAIATARFVLFSRTSIDFLSASEVTNK